MANNATGGSGGSSHGESVSPFGDDYSLNYLLQSYMEQGSEKNLQPQIDQLAGTGGLLPIWKEDQGIQAAAQTQPCPHGQPAGTGGVPIWTTNQGIQAAVQTQPWQHGEPQGTGGLPIWTTNQGIQAAAQTQPWLHGEPRGTGGLPIWTTNQGSPAATQIPIWTTNQGIPVATQMPIWTTNQGIQAAAQTQPWPHGLPAGTGGIPIWMPNQEIPAEPQTQLWPQQQVTGINGFSPGLWTTKKGCQASAATPLSKEPATNGMITRGRSAGNEEERGVRRRENDRKYRRRQKEKMEDLENAVGVVVELWSEVQEVKAEVQADKAEVQAVKAEVRCLIEHVLGNQRLQPHSFNEMAQEKIFSSREFEEGPALTNSQTPSSSEPRPRVQEKVLPQAVRRCMIRFQEKRKQRKRNAAPYNPCKAKKCPERNN